MSSAGVSSRFERRLSAWILCIASACFFGCAKGTSDTNVTTGEASSSDATAAPAPTPDLSPRIDEPSVKPGINDPYFRANGLETYTRILEAETREIVQRRGEIVDAIGLEKGMVVADIGAGTGLLTTGMAKRVGPRGTVFAVDIVPAFLKRIRERTAAEGLSNVIVVRGGERATGLDPVSLDLAFMCDTYHHIEYPEAYMRSLFRTLRPGALLVLVDMKRPQDQSSPAILRHVRADKRAVIAEVERAGFVFDSEIDLLRENYYLRFQRP